MMGFVNFPNMNFFDGLLRFILVQYLIILKVLVKIQRNQSKNHLIVMIAHRPFNLFIPASNPTA